MSKELTDRFRPLMDKNVFALYNGIHVTDLSEDSCEGYMDVTENSMNIYGSIPGGAYFTLADVVASMPARTDGRVYVTQSVDVHYLSTTKECRVFAKSWVVKRGRSSALVECELKDSTGKLLVKTTFTMFCKG